MSNWSCNVCTFENASTKTKCDMCGTSRNATEYTGSWQCTKCTFLNENGRNKCEMCNEAKPFSNTTTTTTTTTTTSTYTPTTSTTVTKPKEEETISCKYCTFKNKKTAEKCVSCNKYLKFPTDIKYDQYTGQKCTNYYEPKDLIKAIRNTRAIESLLPEEYQEEICTEISEFCGLSVWDINSKAKDIEISIINYRRYCHLEEDEDRDLKYCTIALNEFIDPTIEREDNIHIYYLKFVGEIQKNSRELSLGIITSNWLENNNNKWNNNSGIGDDNLSWGIYSYNKDKCEFYHNGKSIEGISNIPGLPRCPTEKDVIIIEINPFKNYIQFKLEGRGGGEARLALDSVKKCKQSIRIAATFLCKHNMIGIKILDKLPNKNEKN